MAKKFKQGKYIPQNREKYIGDINKITYRSSWEERFMLYLDLNKSVNFWSSEEIIVMYSKQSDGGKVHRYFPDFYAEITTSNGNKKFLIEIKPVKDTVLYEPKKKTPKSNQRVVESAITMTDNQDKWNAAKEFCKINDMTFMVLTENELFN
jgi:hypothetical protein